MFPALAPTLTAAPSAAPELSLAVPDPVVPSRGFWHAAAAMAGAHSALVTAVTYASPDCSGRPVRTQTAGSTSNHWALSGPSPLGVRRFSVRATAGGVSSACREISVSGPTTLATPVHTTLASSTSPAAHPSLSVVPAYDPFPNDVLWSGTISLTGGVVPGGTLTLEDFPGSGCSGQSDWQDSLSFTSGTNLGHQQVLGYALPTAGSYSVLAQYSGDAGNAAASSCTAYTVSSQGTGDALALDLPSSTAAADQLLSISLTASGLAGTAQSMIQLDLGAGNCEAPALSSWIYPTGSHATASFAPSVTVPPPGAYGFSATLFPDANDSGVTTSCSVLTSSAAASNSAGDYVPLPPFRILDTRDGTGSTAAPLGPGGVITVAATGVPGSGVPSSGVSAVVVNVTADAPTQSSFLTVWPAGMPRPGVSNLNFASGQTIPNLVTARVGSGGQLSIFNSAGLVSVIADVLGYYSDGSTGVGSRLTPSSPFRILDTRSGQGTAHPGALGARSSLKVTVAGVNGVPQDAVAVVLNVTVTDTTAPSFLTVWPSGSGRPTASNLNWPTGTTIANQVIARVGDGGEVGVFNLDGRVDVVADVMGWYRPAGSSPSGLQLYAVAPVRALDTRSCSFVATSYATSVAGCPTTLDSGGGVDAVVTTEGVPVSAAAVVANTTVTNTTAASYLTVWQSGQSAPVASNLNWTAGSTVANLVLCPVAGGGDAPGEVSIRNYSGSTDVVMDVAGYFVPPSSASAVPPAGVSTQAASTGATPYDWGVYIAASQAESDTFPNLSLIDSVEQGAGQHMAYVMWYVKWGDAQTGAFNAAAVNDVLRHGSIPQISWQSSNPYNYADPAFTDSAIAAGSQDAYLHTWAAGLRAIAATVQVRLDYEMNGSWSPWAPGNYGNTPSSFVAMWRHVHDLFAADGVTNVQWLWTPNTDFPAAIPMASVYPGDAYVDWLGMDGYNHIPFNPDGRWDSPSQVFGQTLAELEAISSKPLMISEVGCAEAGGDKAQWIAQFFAYVRATPRIHDFIWFDISKETDWRIDSSASSLAAFNAGLRAGDTTRSATCSQQLFSPLQLQGQVDIATSLSLGRPVDTNDVPTSC
jgi:hypothetical protein